MNITDCFFFKIFKWRCSSLLMSWSRWWRKYPILAQALSAISLVIFRGCVRLLLWVLFVDFFLFWWGWLILLGWVVSCLMFIPVVNAILYIVGFYFFIVIASRICLRFLLLSLYMIFVLLIRIFPMSGDLSLSVSLLYLVIRCCFMAIISERW